MTMTTRNIYAFWCRHPSHKNFGDALTPWLIKKIAGRHPNFIWPTEPFEKYLVVGSIIGYTTSHCTVWGAGILHRNDNISPRAKLLAVRGPVTRQRAIECGVECPEVYGDPALLLPKLYQPAILESKVRLGILPHYLDKARVLANWNPQPEIKFIDVQQPITSVIKDIVSCAFIVSSSLHGIIAANAYGIPSLWVEFSKKPHGDGSKFRDYFQSIGQEPYEPLRLAKGKINFTKLIKRMLPLKMNIDLNLLWHVCPFRPTNELHKDTI